MFLWDFLKFKKGQGLVEYALVIALVTLLVLGSITLLVQGRIPTFFTNTANSLPS